jgi:hypothetical protein
VRKRGGLDFLADAFVDHFDGTGSLAFRDTDTDKLVGPAVRVCYAATGGGACVVPGGVVPSRVVLPAH